MNFLADQDVYAKTIGILRNLGHTVVPAAELGLARASDSELLRIANERQWLLITRDRDYGSLAFVHEQGAGIVYLRLNPQSEAAVHRELTRVLHLYSPAELGISFVVVEPGRHRIRKLRSKPTENVTRLASGASAHLKSGS